MVTRLRTLLVGAFFAAMLAVGVGTAYAETCGCSGNACGGCILQMGGCPDCTPNCANCEISDNGQECDWTSWECPN